MIDGCLLLWRVRDRVGRFSRRHGLVGVQVDVVGNEPYAGVAHSKIRPGGMQTIKAVVPLPLIRELIQLVDASAIVERNAARRDRGVLAIPPGPLAP